MNTFDITIDSTKVSADLTSFPVYVDLSLMPASFWAAVTTGGGDIRVYQSDGVTEVAREVVSCDTTTDTGELHFLADFISSSSDTVFKITVDGASADYGHTDTFGRNAVWADYQGVWHLQEAVNNTTGGYIDSTGNGYDGTGVSMALMEQPGALNGGKAQDFNGTADFIRLAHNNLGNSGTFSVGAWMKTNDGSQQMVVGKYKSTGPFNGWNMFLGVITAGRISTYTNNAGWLTGATNVADNSWHQCYIHRDGSNWRVYVDGSLDGGPVAGSYSNSNQDAAIGARQDNSQFYDGLIDEVRIRASALSADWMATEHENQSDPSSFFTIAEATSEGPTHTLTVDVGSFTQSGMNTGLFLSFRLSPVVSSLALSGQVTNVVRRLKLVADTGPFAAAGTVVNFGRSYTLSADTGAFSLTGYQAGLSTDAQIVATTGSFAFTGNQAQFVLSRVLSASGASYDLSGDDTGLLTSRSLSTEPEAIVWSGLDTGLVRVFTLSSDTAPYLLSGIPSELALSRLLDAETSGYALTGNDAEFVQALTSRPYCPAPSPYGSATSPYSDLPPRAC